MSAVRSESRELICWSTPLAPRRMRASIAVCTGPDFLPYFSGIFFYHLMRSQKEETAILFVSIFLVFKCRKRETLFHHCDQVTAFRRPCWAHGQRRLRGVSAAQCGAFLPDMTQVLAKTSMACQFCRTASTPLSLPSKICSPNQRGLNDSGVDVLTSLDFHSSTTSTRTFSHFLSRNHFPGRRGSSRSRAALVQ